MLVSSTFILEVSNKPKKLRMPSLTGVLALPFPLSCRLVSLGARTLIFKPRGMKFGLISFIGNKVVGSTSPTLIPFANEGSKLLHHAVNTGPEKKGLNILTCRHTPRPRHSNLPLPPSNTLVSPD